MLEERFALFISNITRITKNIEKIKSREMSAFGLRGTHSICLFYLQSETDGLTSTELSKLCEIDKAAISRAINELDKLGLVSCQTKDCNIKYRSKITLTEKGITLVKKIDEIIEAEVEAAGAGLSDTERASFYKALSLISANLQCMTI